MFTQRPIDAQRACLYAQRTALAKNTVRLKRENEETRFKLEREAALKSAIKKAEREKRSLETRRIQFERQKRKELEKAKRALKWFKKQEYIKSQEQTKTCSA